MIRKGVLCALLVFLGSSQEFFGQISSARKSEEEVKIHADLIVIKFKLTGSSNSRISSSDRINQLKDLTGFENSYQVFSNPPLSGARSTHNDLRNIYKLKYKPGTNLWKELSKLQHLEFIEYAEPFFTNKLLLIPNDPQADPESGMQDYLTVVRAYDGWQIDQSDSTRIIGIVDTGINMNHEDLGNIAFNYEDPINGIDDDADGFIDNFHGWDVGNGDNDPTVDGNGHGTHVTGISSATVNNSIGMAGLGFNSRYLPIKAWNGTLKTLINEYEGIIYAADHGCDVINLSWGGPGYKSQYGQDIINYAVLEKNVVVIAAAGNTHEELDFYPASYDNVLSVGATDMEDNMASWATFSHFIDIMAPGQQIYSTINNGDYGKSGGSSFAAPMVAGAAALVRSHFPSFTAQQVMEQLRVSSDDIYNVGTNMDYFGKMGRGRLNVHKALSDILTPAIRLSNFEYSGNHDKLIFSGDSVELHTTFTNYLRNAENVTIKISNPTDNVSWEIDQIYIDKLGEFESFSNTDNPIFFVVDEDAAPGERLLFRIDYIGNYYTDFQYFELIVTPDYFDFGDEKLTATIASDGDIGYDDLNFRNGNGVSYLQDHIATNTGLIVSLDSLHTLDNVINDFEHFTRDQDFSIERSIKLFDNSIADNDARSVFSPGDTIGSKLDIKIEQKILSWDKENNDAFLIFEYRIINTGDSTLKGINVGLFADWDLGDHHANEAVWDFTDEFGYVFDKSTNNLYSGLALLTEQTKSFYSIDLESRNGNTADFDILFHDSIKHRFISADQQKYSAGAEGLGNDVAHIIGSKNIILPPKKVVKVAIAMLASNSLTGLRNALGKARAKYSEYQADPPLLETFFACDGDSALVDPIGEAYEFYLDVAATDKLDSGSILKTEPVYQELVFYATNLDSGYASDIGKILVKPGNPSANFLMESDTLLIEAGGSEQIGFENTSLLSDRWQWNFGNDYASIVENPTTSYQVPGIYDVELISSNSYGCTDTVTKSLLVATRLERPVVSDLHICKATSTMITASNTDIIEVYSDLNDSLLLFEGLQFQTGNLLNDTSFYIVNAAGMFKSKSVKVDVFVNHPEMGFEYAIDTTELNEKYLLTIFNSSGPEDNITWMVDGQVIGNNANVQHKYDQNQFDISQIKFDQNSCIDTLTKTIKPSYSDIPVVEDAVICKESDFTIKPQNGEIFAFYDDSQLNNLLHKGASLKLDIISSDKEIFITGLDGLLESSPASLKVAVDPVRAVIKSLADTVNLQEQNVNILMDQSLNASNSYWLYKTGTIDSTKVIEESYYETGKYEYILIAEGFTGCMDTTFQTIRVVNITGTGLIMDPGSKIRVYPNPVEDWINIEIGHSSQDKIELEIIDIAGNRIKRFVANKDQDLIQIDLQSFSSGMYIIKSMDHQSPFRIKILKN